jgi:hypothetical protein
MTNCRVIRFRIACQAYHEAYRGCKIGRIRAKVMIIDVNSYTHVAPLARKFNLLFSDLLRYCTLCFMCKVHLNICFPVLADVCQ